MTKDWFRGFLVAVDCFSLLVLGASLWYHATPVIILSIGVFVSSMAFWIIAGEK